MANPHTEQSPSREVFILRVWQNPSRRSWIVEIQAVRTGVVTHLNSLEAIPAFIAGQTRSNRGFPEPPVQDLP